MAKDPVFAVHESLALRLAEVTEDARIVETCLKDMQFRIQRIQSSLGGLVAKQRQLFERGPSKAASEDVERQRGRVKAEAEDVERAVHVLNSLMDSKYLMPVQLLAVEELFAQATFSLKRFDLLSAELQLLSAERQPLPCVVGLVITRQPFPAVFLKGDALKDQLHVQLVTGAATRVHSVKPIRAAICTGVGFSSISFSMNDDKSVENGSQPLSPRTGVAEFPLTLTSGTRKDCASVRFAAEVHLRDYADPSRQNVAYVESLLSKPFIVMTNQKQWDSCEGILIRQLAFKGQLEVPWPRFCNFLSSQFFAISRLRQLFTQDLRPLSAYDLQYLRDKWVDGRKTVTVKEFERFWAWFGATCHTLKYQKHVCLLWHRGFISGFLSRDDANVALLDQPPGSILIRFSESLPGQLVISHTPHEAPAAIKHYLVRITDTSEKITLPDFLRHQSQWRYLLRYATDPTTGVPGFSRVSKQAALESFYSKGVNDDLLEGTGYDPL